MGYGHTRSSLPLDTKMRRRILAKLPWATDTPEVRSRWIQKCEEGSWPNCHGLRTRQEFAPAGYKNAKKDLGQIAMGYGHARSSLPLDTKMRRRILAKLPWATD